MPGRHESDPGRKPRRPLPDWARDERGADLAWIQENLFMLGPAAREQYQALGRGAVVVDTTVNGWPHAGHPVWYLPENELEPLDEPDVKRMLLAYNPRREMVLVLLKREGRQSGYRIVLPPQEPELN